MLRHDLAAQMKHISIARHAVSKYALVLEGIDVLLRDSRKIRSSAVQQREFKHHDWSSAGKTSSGLAYGVIVPHLCDRIQFILK